MRRGKGKNRIDYPKDRMKKTGVMEGISPDMSGARSTAGPVQKDIGFGL